MILPNSVTSIGNGTFWGCQNLTMVTIPNSVTSIGDGVFNSCSNLTSVTIGNSVMNIPQGTFYGCYRLTSVAIGNSVTSIGYEAFYQCYNLTEVTIPNSVTNIGWKAFMGCSGLTSVTIPNSVTSIEDEAFSGCLGLTSLTISNSVTSIGDYTFSVCSNLTFVTIPNSVTSIGKGAFWDCTGLTSVTIGNSAMIIGSLAFNGCGNLRELHSNNITPPECHQDTFNNVKTANCRLYVPTGSKEDYAFSVGWGDFVNIIEESVVNTSDDIEKPTISYNNKKLLFSCGTPNVTYSYTINAEDNTSNLADSESGEINLSAMYVIAVYAKRDNETSKPTTATLVWATATFTPGEATSAKEIAVDALPLLITQEDGMVTVSGVADGAMVTAYSSNGTMVASAKAIGNAALLNLSDLQGKVAVLNVGGKSAKIAIK